MSLEYAEPETSFAGMNVLLYGGPKTGKTLGACSAPPPVLLLNADTADASRMAHRAFGDQLKEVRLTSENVEKVLDLAYLALSTNDAQGFRSVVVDPIADVHRLLLEHRSNSAIRPSRDHYGDVSVKLERFCRALCQLPIVTVLVTHEQPVKDEETGGFERLPYTGTSNPALGGRLMQMVSVIGYTGVVLPEDGGEEADPVYVSQLVNANGRRGGDRTGVLGKFRETDVSDWVGLANGAGPAKTDEAKEG